MTLKSFTKNISDHFLSKSRDKKRKIEKNSQNDPLRTKFAREMFSWRKFLSNQFFCNVLAKEAQTQDEVEVVNASNLDAERKQQVEVDWKQQKKLVWEEINWTITKGLKFNEFWEIEIRKI